MDFLAVLLKLTSKSLLIAIFTPHPNKNNSELKYYTDDLVKQVKAETCEIMNVRLLVKPNFKAYDLTFLLLDFLTCLLLYKSV